MTTLIAVLGDFHIPTRAYEIPPIISSFIRDRKPEIILCTGDLVEGYVLDYLKELADEVKVVEGNMDRIRLPRSRILNVENLKIGLIHGHQVFPRGNVHRLTQLAIRMKVDVLISGHTHSPFIKCVNNREHGILLLNPGSATGVWSGSGGSMIPSFMLLRVDQDKITVSLYEKYDTLKLSRVMRFEF